MDGDEEDLDGNTTAPPEAVAGIDVVVADLAAGDDEIGRAHV